MKKKTTTGAAELINLSGEENSGGAAVRLRKKLLGASSQSMKPKGKMKMKGILKTKSKMN